LFKLFFQVKKIFLFFFFSCFYISLFSQEDLENRDAFLAKQFYENGAFDKAAEYYKTLINEPNGYDLYYEDYKQTLIQLKDWTTLKKLVKTIYKESGKNPIYQLELAAVHQLAGENEEAQKLYEML
jgi:tetratricopeptide (TPR) repeat protein